MLVRVKVVKLGIICANLLVIVLLVALLVNIFTIPLLKPEDRTYITERRPEFMWGGVHREYEFLLDDDENFETPFVAKVLGNSFRFNNDLDFGTYYWKVRSGIFESNVRRFTLGSSVVLTREKNEVRNEGNTDVILHRMTGAVILKVGSSALVGEEENVTAEQV